MGKSVQWVNDAGERLCSRCGVYLSPDLFNKAGNGRLSIYCRMHQSEIRREHYARHRAQGIAYARAYRAAHPESTRSESARLAKRGYKLRQALANGAYARRLQRQARDTRDTDRLRRWLRDARVTHSVQDAQRLLGCSYKRARRLYVLAGGVIGAKGAHPSVVSAREEQVG